MSKMNSYKKLYLTGFLFVVIIAVCLVYSILYVSKMYFKRTQSNDITLDSLSATPDTVYQEKIVEKIKRDTLKIYVYPKPKIEKDTSTSSLSSSSTQSQD